VDDAKVETMISSSVPGAVFYPRGQAKAFTGGIRMSSTGRRYIEKFMSRTHLYAGLFISPFVVLFALTAIGFNHAWAGAGD